MRTQQLPWTNLLTATFLFKKLEYVTKGILPWWRTLSQWGVVITAMIQTHCCLQMGMTENWKKKISLKTLVLSPPVYTYPHFLCVQ